MQIVEDSYKVIFLADIHMSNNLSYSKPTKNGMTDRFEDQLEFWKLIKSKCEELSIDAVFILGDLFDKALLDAVTLTHTVDAIVSLPCDVYILPGNHDSVSLDGGRFTVEAFSAMNKSNIKCLDENMVKINEYLRFYPVPFSSTEAAEKQIESYRKQLNDDNIGHDILLLHHSIIGCDHNDWTCDKGLLPDFVCEGFSYVLAGHFHRNQYFGTEDKGRYVGSPMQFDFGDEGITKSFRVYKFTPEKFYFTTHFPRCPEFYVRKIDSKESLEKVDPGYGVRKGDFFRYEIKTTPEKWIEMKDEVEKKCKKINDEYGIKASWKYVPIRKFKKRINLENCDEKVVRLEDYMEKYVDIFAKKNEGVSEKNITDILETGQFLLKEARDVS
jgi:DNA repair exonuclease SbcCD nuclease subunit